MAQFPFAAPFGTPMQPTVTISQEEAAATTSQLAQMQQQIKGLTIMRQQCIQQHNPERIEQLERSLRKAQQELQDARNRLKQLHSGLDDEVVSGSTMSRKQFEESLHAGMFVDAVDQANEWLIAVVKLVTANDVLIQFHGWGDEWNQWIPKKSKKIAPFGSKTKGGQHRTATSEELSTPSAAIETLQLENSRLRVSLAQWKRMVDVFCGTQDEAAVAFRMFEKCFAIEDQLKAAGPHLKPDSMETKISEIEKDLSKLEPGLGDAARSLLQACTRMCADFRAALAGSQQTDAPMSISTAKQYKLYIEEHFHSVELPNNGDCLFAAVGQGVRVNEFRARNPTATAEDVATGTRKQQDNEAVGRQVRAVAVKRIREHHALYGRAIETELQQALAADDASDTTARLLREEMLKAFPLHPERHAGSVHAKDVYTNVMARRGVNGWNLELRALAEQYQCPIFVYYHSPTDPASTAEAPKPVLACGVEFSAHNAPIHLLYTATTRQFDLLIPKDKQSVEDKEEKSDAEETKQQSGMMDLQSVDSLTDQAVVSSRGRDRERTRPQLLAQRSISPERSPGGPPTLLKERSRYHAPVDSDDDDYDDDDDVGNEVAMTPPRNAMSGPLSPLSTPQRAASDNIVRTPPRMRPTSSTPLSSPSRPVADSSASSSSPGSGAIPAISLPHSFSTSAVGAASPVVASLSGRPSGNGSLTDLAARSPMPRLPRPITHSLSELTLDKQRRGSSYAGSLIGSTTGSSAGRSARRTITVVLRYGDKAREVNIPRDEPMSTIINAFAKQNGQPRDRLVFRRGGKPIIPQLSPDALSFKDREEIVVSRKK